MIRHLALSVALCLSACAEDPPASPAPDPLSEGWRAARAGDHETAAARYEAAAEARPGDAETWAALARERLRAEQPAAAIEAARRAVEADDASADAHELLGRALLEAESAEGSTPPGERATEAAAALRRALELDPERRRVHFALARAEELATHPDQAVEAYRASAEAGVLPARSLVAAARTRLDALGSSPVGAALSRQLETELDRAAELAGDDEVVRRAIVAQRRRLARKRTGNEPVRRSDERMRRSDERMSAREMALEIGRLGRLTQNPLQPEPLGDAFASGAHGTVAGLGQPPPDYGRGGGGSAAEAIGGIGSLGRGGGSSGYGRGTDEVAPVVSLGAVTTTGAIDQAVAARVVRRHLHPIRFCYERELSSNAGLSGELTLRLDVGPDGRVTGTQVSGSTMPASVERCVRSQSNRVRFPAVEGGGTVTAPYSFGT